MILINVKLVWVFYFVTTSDFLSYFLSSTHTNHATLLILIIICNEIIMTNISESGSESGLILAIFHRIKTRQLTWLKKACLVR